MKSALFDGSFEGLLTLLRESYKHNWIPEALYTDPQAPLGLFEERREIVSNLDTTAHTLEVLRTCIGEHTLQESKVAWLNDADAPYLSLLYYWRLGIQNPTLLQDINRPEVRSVQSAIARVRREAHRLTGFVRFSEVEDGSWYAPYYSETNVLPLLIPHFQKRFGQMRFILHDTKREIGAYYDTHKTHILPIRAIDTPSYTNDEGRFRELWRCFFEAISIEERKNLPLQQQHIPLKYRHLMTEFAI